MVIGNVYENMLIFGDFRVKVNINEKLHILSVTEEFLNSPSSQKSENILNHNILANLDQVYLSIYNNYIINYSTFRISY